MVLPQRSAQCNFLAKSGRIPGMLDPANTSLREDFAASQINLDLLSYQKNPIIMPSSLKKIFKALKTISLL